MSPLRALFKANVKDSKNEFILKLLRFYVFLYDTIVNEQGELQLYVCTFFGFRLEIFSETKECVVTAIFSPTSVSGDRDSRQIFDETSRDHETRILQGV